MRIITLLSLLLTTSFCFSQSAMDAYRLSQSGIGGTARFIGTAGSLSALGGDFSVASVNPAGMTGYRSPHLMFNMELHKASSTTNFLGANQAQNKYSFNINNFGLVLAESLKEESVASYAFGIGMNNINTFDNEFYFEGQSPHTIAQFFADYANQVTVNPDFKVDYAKNTNLIYVDANGNYAADPTNGASVLKKQTVNTSGYLNELVINGAVNIEEQLSFGATLGIPFYFYQENKRYIETDVNDAINVFNSVNFGEDLKTNGAGINLKLGVLYHKYFSVGEERLKFSIGGAVHTPSMMWLTDIYAYDMTTNLFVENEGNVDYVDFDSYGGDERQEFEYSYQTITPWKVMGNLGVALLKKGFLTAEVEYVDYSTMQQLFDGASDVENSVNNNIATNFESGLNVKIGAEVVLSKILRLRGGMATNSNPIVGENDFNRTFTLGVGAYFDHVYFDLAYINQSQTFYHTPYFDPSGTIKTSPNFPIQVERTTPSVSLTVGFRLTD